MLNRFSFGPLMDEAPVGGGMSDTVLVDPGTPFEHGGDAPAVKAPKSDIEKRLEALEEENKSWKVRTERAEEDAKFWSRKVQQGPSQPQRVVVETTPVPIVPASEKPAAFLDDVTAKGLDALKDRGVITKKELDEALAQKDRETEGKISAAREDAEFGARVGRDFPDIAADSARVARGERPQSPLWDRTAEIYKELVADDPELEGTKSALLLSCRQAKAEADATKKAKPRVGTDEDDDAGAAPARRERVARQRPDRSQSADETSGDPQFTKQDLEVMSRLGVKPEEFARHGGGRRR